VAPKEQREGTVECVACLLHVTRDVDKKAFLLFLAQKVNYEPVAHPRYFRVAERVNDLEASAMSDFGKRQPPEAIRGACQEKPLWAKVRFLVQ
jgi:hypothetical protein